MDDTRTTHAPETDDSGNMTEAAPDRPAEEIFQMPGPETIEEPAETSAGDAAGTEGGTPDEKAASQGGSRRPDVQQMVGQLQQMIDQLATQASPALKEVAAKAAELASAAAVKAGPIAHKAAGMTESVGQRVADRSAQVATNLRNSRSPSGAAPHADDQPSPEKEAVGE